MLLLSRVGPVTVVGAFAAALVAIEWATGNPGALFGKMTITVGLSLVLSSDVLNIRRGTLVLWAQKPVSPVRFYLASFWETAVTAAALTTFLRALISVGAMLAGWELEPHPLRSDLASSLLSLVVVSVAFGASVWLPRTGQFVALGLVILALAMEIMLALAPTDSDRLWISLFRVIVVPWQALGQLAGLEAYESVNLAGPLVRILGYVASWVTVGGLGVRWVFTYARGCHGSGSR